MVKWRREEGDRRKEINFPQDGTGGRTLLKEGGGILRKRHLRRQTRGSDKHSKEQLGEGEGRKRTKRGKPSARRGGRFFTTKENKSVYKRKSAAVYVGEGGGISSKEREKRSGDGGASDRNLAAAIPHTYRYKFVAQNSSMMN